MGSTKQKPDDLTDEEFNVYMQSEEGLQYLENFRTSQGNAVGSYEKNVKNPFEQWKISERKKYEKYFNYCISGNNASGRKLFPGVIPEEIYAIDIWREQKEIPDTNQLSLEINHPDIQESKKKEFQNLQNKFYQF